MSFRRDANTGNLKIELINSKNSAPVDNATVQIWNTENTQIIEELTTNSSGQTEPISLPAPPVEYSLAPDNPKPFSEYNINILTEDFNDVIISNSQIFSTSNAIQKVELEPITNRRNINIIEVDYPTLWGDYPDKIPESPVKELPPPTGFVVLDQPVIPEYIIVHDGEPNAYAKDYWIPFKDYIKNVASSEIYSTWPFETIKANVLAILSFTLNRVFTEWYRGKGKNFTITSVTNFDQKFSYGRTIYKNISEVVDQIFNNYITKPNIRQPLFTQYCDGSNSTCPTWLSQWGSKSLGDQGVNYLNILKKYYGNDIYIETAKTITGVPVSYPGAPLQLGSSGNSVKIIQRQLNRIAEDFPAINTVKVDGFFGEETELAVKTFQEIFNLTPDGIVGLSTWYKISDIFVAVSKLAG